MRLCLIILLGLMLTACGLSMNPDLPSTKEENSPPFGGGSEGPDEGNSGIDLGDGDESAPIFEAPAGAGGVFHNCGGPGGDGGAAGCEGEP